MPTDRGWTRDFGPICVRRERPAPEVAVARFRFSGWAKYPDHGQDDLVAERVARMLRLPVRHAVHAGRPVVLEGGAVDVDGSGTLLTTEECLLDEYVQVRNPGTLGELFADRPVVGIHAVDLVWGLGTLHCLTQQQPRA